MSNIRVRWAPSNTGPDVHIGNVRTILFNYLFAKKNKGTTIFRIEDSDMARSKPEFADAISESLNWLGLRADEGYKIGGDYGPYLQTEKIERYKQVANELIEKGLAYRCYCTSEELNALRNELPEKMRERFKYPNICRDRKDWPKDKDYVIRVKAPTEGSVSWDDIVFKKMIVPNKENYDWVIMRSNGIPLYNFGCCVDDLDQKITHVIRGRDHTVNTNIQILLHQMIGTHDITYCHLPMMLGQDGAKLSKRHAAVSINDYRLAGYSPGGILNYLVRFGFGFGNQEIFSMEELVDKFSLEACGRNDGKFDPKKFSAIQFEHLRSIQLTSDNEYAKHLLPFIKGHGYNPSIDDVAKIVPLVREKTRNFVEAANLISFYFNDTVKMEEAAATTLLTNDNKEKISMLSDVLRTCEWEESVIKTTTQSWLAEKNITLKDIGQAIRLSITGKVISPELFQTMHILGKDKVVERLKYASG
jgi:glutamyl-tRNA synthetase